MIRAFTVSNQSDRSTTLMPTEISAQLKSSFISKLFDRTAAYDIFAVIKNDCLSRRRRSLRLIKYAFHPIFANLADRTERPFVAVTNLRTDAHLLIAQILNRHPVEIPAGQAVRKDILIFPDHNLVRLRTYLRHEHRMTECQI